MLSRGPSLTFLACFVYLPQLPLMSDLCNGDNGIPPAILNESIEIPRVAGCHLAGKSLVIITRQIRGEVGFITRRGRLLTGHAC